MTHWWKSALRPAKGKRGWLRTLSLMMAAVCLFAGLAVSLPGPTAYAATSVEDLERQLQVIKQNKQKHEAELKAAKQKTAAAAAVQNDLKSQVNILQNQISLLKSRIATVQNGIGIKEQEISEKEQEIAQMEADMADQWEDFKARMAVMQELREGGSVAMLSGVKDFYELLTFSEMLQDISRQDTKIMDEMKAARDVLQKDRAELIQARESLRAQQEELTEKTAQMNSKQGELNASLAEANLTYKDAAAAQKQAQAAVDSDEMDYEAVQKAIQKIIAEAATSQKNSNLSFNGFACPLKSYTRVSSEYGYRTNPVTGKYKLHGGIDFAAPKGTPIYAAASGYVSVAGWSSSGYGNYVVIYHGKMKDGKSYSSLYGHMNSIATSKGAYVKQGQVIGYVGTTGQSTGNHLHLEIWQGQSSASRVNPRSFVPIPHN